MGGENKLYYINIDFINLASGNASVQYKEFEDDRERVVYAGTQYTVDVIVMTTQRPEFNMVARQLNKEIEYYLNGQHSWLIQGSEFKGERHVIRITDRGLFLEVFYCSTARGFLLVCLLIFWSILILSLSTQRFSILLHIGIFFKNDIF